MAPSSSTEWDNVPLFKAVNMPAWDDLRTRLEDCRKAIDAQYNEAQNLRAKLLDMLGAAFLKTTGLDPENTMLVEEHSIDGTKWTWRFEPRVPEENREVSWETEVDLG